MDELVASSGRDRSPPESLLVLDAMTGQDAVRVGRGLPRAIALDGIVLTKLDGDARGGAALSVGGHGRRSARPRYGERPGPSQYFHPDRMASRILGMGDVLSLVEKAKTAVRGETKPRRWNRNSEGGHVCHARRLPRQPKIAKWRNGPARRLLKLIPGVGSKLKDLESIDKRHSRASRRSSCSMTKHERRLTPRHQRLAEQTDQRAEAGRPCNR